MTALRWIGIAAATLAALALAVVLVGAALPRAHVASRSVHVVRPPGDVWRTITGVSQFPQWRPDVSAVERLPDREPGGRAAWCETGANGRITYELVEADPPRRLVTRIADDALPFGGSWTYELAPAPDGGTTVTITEHGEVRNPVFRFVSRFVMGHHATIDAYLEALQNARTATAVISRQ